MRIVSLIPSATEIALALGLEHELVGVTFECDFPGDPRVGRAVLVGGLHTEGLDTAAIDALVREKVAAGELLYTLDEEQFREVAPDVVLTQDLCRVCALPSGQVDEAMDRLGCSATVVTMDPHTVDAILDSIVDVGAATGRQAAAEALVVDLRRRIVQVGEAVAGASRPRVFVLEWPDPPFVAGHWVPELVELAGGEPVVSRPGERSVATTWDEVAAVDADVVIVSSCGFDAAGSEQHARDVLHRLPPSAQVWAIDANGLMVRPGPRVVDGVEALALILHGSEPPGPAVARRVR